MDPRYTVEAGRQISRNGVPVYTLHKAGNDSDGYAASPVEADEFVKHAVRCVNSHQALVDALRAVLIFHHGGEWTAENRKAWRSMTSTTEATSRNLCDCVRSALDQAEEDAA